MIPLYNNFDPVKKENYRAVSLLPHVSKVFESIIYQQINAYMKVKLSKCLAGFIKSHRTQHLLVIILEKWKKALDKGKYLSQLEAFDTINRDLLLAKLKAYGLSLNAVKLMRSYLKNRKQQVQTNNELRPGNIVIAGVPQGSIDVPLLFNLFVNDFIFFMQYYTLRNYAHDNNSFPVGKNTDETKTNLSSDFRVVNGWLYESFMVLNPEKSHFISLGKDIAETENLSFNRLALRNSEFVEILGITLDRSMGFNIHIKNICRKADQKVSALLLSRFLDQGKKFYYTNQ